jgi:hypothetical protein
MTVSRKEGGEKMQIRMNRPRTALVLSLIGVAALAYGWGRPGSLSQATAAPPGAAPGPVSPMPTAPV